MNKNFMMFTIGVGTGVAATYFYFKNKYAKMAQEEIESVIEVFSKKKSEPTEKETVAEPSKPVSYHTKKKEDVNVYASKLKEQEYHIYEDAPYVITPDEFGENDDYETISLIYYSDLMLTDDDDELIEDVENTVGFESLNHFGEYEDDCVFVRNDRLRSDFEILLDKRKYSDVMKNKPPVVLRR